MAGVGCCIAFAGGGGGRTIAVTEWETGVGVRGVCPGQKSVACEEQALGCTHA